MGQAMVDLPDPLDAPPPTLSGTDDLLAQLAGDEIDRLLAESDAERTPAASAPAPTLEQPAPTPEGVVAPPSAEESPSIAPNTVVADAAVAPAPVAALAPAPVSDVTDALSMDAELDALLNQLNQSGAEVAPVPTPAAAAPEAPKTLTEQVPGILAQFGDATPPADPPAPSTTLAATDAPEAVMSVAERDALSLSNLDAETDAAEEADALAAAAALEASTPRQVRVAIRLLEVLNAPLAFVPDAARDLLGKAAILTLVNSIAVLIYVLFVRR